MKIKVCGMRDQANVEALVNLPIDYIGFIFYPPSPRYVGDEFDTAVVNAVPGHIQKTGVFVNATMVEIQRKAEKFGLNCLQLHGNETPDYCIALKEKGFTIIKAFKADVAVLTCETINYKYACDYFLFDTPTPKHGGSGLKFDWKILKQQNLTLPYFLSGGIAPGDEQAIKEFNDAGFYAIDLNSKFEISPAEKNIPELKKFIENLKDKN
jgi:phosphoribosylanthranilate isomerase